MLGLKYAMLGVLKITPVMKQVQKGMKKPTQILYSFYF